ncbi:MAG: hypothetical protein ACPGVV_05190, partial [Croceimicrobium sp.]
MSSCESEPEVDLNQIPIDTKVKRFERAFYNLDTGNFISELNSIKGESYEIVDLPTKGNAIFYFLSNKGNTRVIENI